MNPTLVHMGNYSATEDDIATSNGYLLSSNGWATLEPRAAYDNRVAMMMTPQDVQGHSLQTSVSPLHYSSMTPLLPPPRVQFFLRLLVTAGIRTLAVSDRDHRTISRPIYPQPAVPRPINPRI